MKVWLALFTTWVVLTILLAISASLILEDTGPISPDDTTLIVLLCGVFSFVVVGIFYGIVRLVMRFTNGEK